MEKTKLPVITDLYSDIELAGKNSALAMLLNQPPKQDWIKENQGIKYIPIEVVEFLLTAIFTKWHVEIKTVQIIANSVCVCVRLHYLNPIDGTMEYQDGVGASPLQTAKDAGAIEFDKIKTFAVQMAAPAAESFAIKDAAEKLGKLFGKDINRKNAFAYDTISNKFEGKIITAKRADNGTED